MPATVQIVQLQGPVNPTPGTGATGLSTPPSTNTENKTSGTLRFQRIDTLDETSFANAIPVPLSGRNYSMRVCLCMYIAALGSPAMIQISNPRWYGDGVNSFGGGRSLWYAMTGTYQQPTIPLESNDPPQFPSSTPMGEWFHATTPITSSNPADGDAINPGPFLAAGVPKYVGDILNLVFKVDSTSQQGLTTTPEPITLSWDEI